MTGLDNVTNVFIGNGAALVNATQFSLSAFTSTGALAVIKGSDMKTTNLSIASESVVYVAQKKSVNDLKKSFAIDVAKITNKKTENFRPAAPCVWAIGYNGGYVSNDTTGATVVGASGAIELNNEAIYELTIVDKSNKQLGSERQIFKRYNYTSDASATQLEIATYFVNAINADFDKKIHNVQAKLVSSTNYAAASGSTPAIFGDATGGTDYGIELFSLPSATYVDQYTIEVPNFEVQINSELGFGATSVRKIQSGSQGSGTLVQVGKFEKFANGFEGQTNYRAWPVIEPASQVLTALDSVTITPTAAILATKPDEVDLNADVYALNSATAGVDAPDINVLHPGASITVNAAAEQTILYFRTKDKAITTSAGTAVGAGAAVTKGTGYVTYSFETSSDVVGSGSRHVYNLPKRVIIFSRAEGAANTISTEATNLATVFAFTVATLQIA
jgi:hypothetical protein